MGEVKLRPDVMRGRSDLRAEMATVAGNVRRFREAAGLSQTELADAMRTAGIDRWRQNTVSRIEHGEQELRSGEIAELYRIRGPVLTGTREAERMSGAAEAFASRQVVDALRRADDALVEALVAVRAVRRTHDPEYADWYREEFPDMSDEAVENLARMTLGARP